MVNESAGGHHLPAVVRTSTVGKQARMNRYVRGPKASMKEKCSQNNSGGGIISQMRKEPREKERKTEFK